MSKAEHLNIITLNVRYDTHASQPVPIPASGHIPPHKHYPWSDPYTENPWSERRSRLVDALLSSGPIDIVGFQEVLHNQLLDLQALLGDQFGSVGVGRNDGKEAGEYSPIFWNRERFEVVRWKTVWLSPTPDVPGSKGWDASQTRIATFLTLSRIGGKDNAGDLIHVVNTHYDDAGVRARAESSLIIRQCIRRWVQRFEDPDDPVHHRQAPIILLGDFNSPADEDGYKNITSDRILPSGLPSFTFIDAFTCLRTRGTISHGSRSLPGNQTSVYGPLNTYSGFTRPGKTATSRIDFIMLAAEHEPIAESQDVSLTVVDRDATRGGWRFVRYAVIDNWVEEGDVSGWQGRWSDHRAVRVTIAQ